MWSQTTGSVLLMVAPIVVCVSDAYAESEGKPKPDFFWVAPGVRAELGQQQKTRLKFVVSQPYETEKSDSAIFSFGKPIGGFSVDGKKYCFRDDLVWPDDGEDPKTYWRDDLFEQLTQMIVAVVSVERDLKLVHNLLEAIRRDAEVKWPEVHDKDASSPNTRDLRR